MCELEASLPVMANVADLDCDQLLDTLAEDGSEPNKELRERFYAEAKRGLDAEEGHISLAYLAALGVQWT